MKVYCKNEKVKEFESVKDILDFAREKYNVCTTLFYCGGIYTDYEYKIKSVEHIVEYGQRLVLFCRDLDDDEDIIVVVDNMLMSECEDIVAKIKDGFMMEGD
jgi:hypothetical protein